MHIKYRLLGVFSLLFGSLGLLLSGFYSYRSFYPKASTPIALPTQVKLKQHPVYIDQRIQQQLITRTAAGKTTPAVKKIPVLIYMDRPAITMKVTSFQPGKRATEQTNQFNQRKQRIDAIQKKVIGMVKPLIANNHLTIKKQFYVDNILLAEIDALALTELKKTPGIVSIIPDAQILIPPLTKSSATVPAQWNLSKIGVDRVWHELGITGKNVVVANIDTGVQWDHPALKSKYRGWDGISAVHDYNWFDPTNMYPLVPNDNIGHGTHTMGTIVGGDETHAIGIAPDATWIAVKGCTTTTCLNSQLLIAAQWILAPTKLDGTNPDPSRAPNIVNNSWGGSSCDPWFTGVLDTWNTAGIISVFSAGNSGPNASTVSSPGDYTQTLTVGATDVSDTVTNFSSRGPSCGAFGSRHKPDISAPGASILSSIPDNSYMAVNGTSMAAPHIAGIAALMLQANPSLTPSAITSILTSSATDFGIGGIDDSYGFGLVNAFKAVTLVPSPTPFPSTTPPFPLKNIQIIQPNGAEQLSPNQQYPIRWVSQGVDQIMLDIIDGNGAFSTIALAMPASQGEFLWTVPSSWYGTSHAFRIKVYEYPSRVTFDISDNYFYILYSSPTPTKTPTMTPTRIPTNTPTPTSIPTAFENAIKLANSPSSLYGTSIDIPVNENFDRWGDYWNIEGWFKPENLTSPYRQYLFFAPLYDAYSTYTGNGIYISNGQLYAEFHTPTLDSTLNAGPITSTWHHIAFTSNNATCYLFLDGILKAQSTGGSCTIPLNTNQYLVATMTLGSKMNKVLSGGTYQNRRSEVFIGQIDEFRLSGQPIYTSSFTVQQFPFANNTGGYQYHFDTLINGTDFASSGTKTTHASIYGSNFQILTSTVPYTPPATPTNTPTNSPSSSPTHSSTPTNTLIPTPILCNSADLNKDGIVDANDRTLLINNYWKASSSTVVGDINSDNSIDLLDYSLLVSRYNQLTGPCL